jgi:CBS domain-containing protein
MKVHEMMTHDVTAVTPDSTLQEAARLMDQEDIGSLPVLAATDDKRPVGVLTDRDITCRIVAAGRNPLALTVAEAMSAERMYTASPDMDEHELRRLMERHQIRRVPVVEEQGNCCGVVTQADLAVIAGQTEAGEVVESVSHPTAEGHTD